MQSTSLNIQAQKQIISNYETLLNSLETLIENSPFKLNFIIEKMEMTRSTFYHKRKHNTFTVHEIKKLLNLFEKVA